MYNVTVFIACPLVIGSYLVMPYMFTDLSKVRGHLSEDKVQFLVYQMLCGLRVSPYCPSQTFTVLLITAVLLNDLKKHTIYTLRHTICVYLLIISILKNNQCTFSYSLSVHSQGWDYPQGEFFYKAAH